MGFIKKIIGIVIIVLLCKVITATTIQQDQFLGYKVVSKTGPERVLYKVEINGLDICLNPEGETSKQETICECTTYSKDLTTCEKETCKTVTYEVPSTLKLTQEDQTLTSITPYLGKYCIQINDPLKNTWLKFGTNSIILAGDTAYNSTDTNITQETGYAHLELSDPNIVLHMPFEINETNTIRDYSTNNNDGTLVNATWQSIGHQGNDGLMNFSKRFDQITVPHDNSINPPDNITISMWINFRSPNTTANTVLLNKGSYRFTYYTNGKIKFTVQNTSGYSGRSAYTSNLANTGWRMLTAVHIKDNSTRTYVDGVLDGNTELLATGEMRNSSTDDLLFTQASVGAYLDASMSEVTIWNKALTVTEMQKLYNKTQSKYKNNGNLLFQNINLGNNDTANITFSDYRTNNGTYIQGKINNGTFQNFSAGTLTNYNLMGNITNANLTIQLISNTNNVLTPLIIGNITIDGYRMTPIPKTDTQVESFGLEWIKLNWTIAEASMTIQYSDDNATWQTITNIDTTNNKAYQINLKEGTNYYFKANDGNGGGDYYFNQTTSGLPEETNMESMSITLFAIVSALLFIMSGLLIPTYTKNSIANMIIKRGLISIGIYLMMFNSAIMSTISTVGNLGLDKEMFRYMWIFGIFGWLTLITIVIKTLWDIKDLMQQQAKLFRMGEEEGGN